MESPYERRRRHQVPVHLVREQRECHDIRRHRLWYESDFPRDIDTCRVMFTLPVGRAALRLHRRVNSAPSWCSSNRCEVFLLNTRATLPRDNPSPSATPVSSNFASSPKATPIRGTLSIAASMSITRIQVAACACSGTLFPTSTSSTLVSTCSVVLSLQFY